MGDARARRRPRSRRQLGEQEQIEGRVHSTAPIDRAPCFACANHRRVGLKLSPDASAYVSIRDPAPAGLEILESPGLLPSRAFVRRFHAATTHSPPGRPGDKTNTRLLDRSRPQPLLTQRTTWSRAPVCSHRVCPFGRRQRNHGRPCPLTCSTPAWTRESVQSVHSKLSQKKVTPFHSPLVSAVQIILH